MNLNKSNVGDLRAILFGKELPGNHELNCFNLHELQPHQANKPFHYLSQYNS